MTDPTQSTGRIESGDVELFYRAFSPPAGGSGRPPVVILHGANYFDSYDWVGVAEQLARDREVVAFDHRGFGQSGWSPNKDYSLDAICGDTVNVSKHFGWDRPVVMGHSFSGRLAIFFAAYFPDHLTRLIVLDSALGMAVRAPITFRSATRRRCSTVSRRSWPPSETDPVRRVLPLIGRGRNWRSRRWMAVTR